MKTTDDNRIERLAQNVAKLASELLKQSAILEKKTKALRLRINVDLKELATEQSPRIESAFTS